MFDYSYSKENTFKRKFLQGLKNSKDKYINSLNANINLEPEEYVWPEVYCEDDMTVDDFLNLNTTKKSLHVANDSTFWIQCANLNYEWSDSIHLYNTTLYNRTKIKKWIFSGTEDGVISTIGTLRWINKLKFNVEKKWKSWKINGQIGGYNQKYSEGLVLVTVKGAGHMVLQDKRKEAKFVLDAFLQGVLPSEMNNK